MEFAISIDHNSPRSPVFLGIGENEAGKRSAVFACLEPTLFITPHDEEELSRLCYAENRTHPALLQGRQDLMTKKDPTLTIVDKDGVIFWCHPATKTMQVIASRVENHVGMFKPYIGECQVIDGDHAGVLILETSAQPAPAHGNTFGL